MWRHPYFLRMGPLGFFTYGGMIAIQTLWAGPWMVNVLGLSVDEASRVLFLFNLIPIAPLDGSKLVGLIIPRSHDAWYHEFLRKGPVILIVLPTILKLELARVASLMPVSWADNAAAPMVWAAA